MSTDVGVFVILLLELNNVRSNFFELELLGYSLGT